MRCPICSHPLEPDATTCPECGTGILAPPAPGVEPTPFVQSHSTPRWPLVLSIIGIVAALVVIAVALLPLLDGDENPVATDDTAVSTTTADTVTETTAGTLPATTAATTTAAPATTGTVATSAAPTTAAPSSAAPTTAAPTSTSIAPSTSSSAAPTTSATPTTTAAGPLPSRLAVASAEATCVASASTDSRGNPITFEAAKTVDGDPETAWRCEGNAANVALLYTLATPGDVTFVSAIPGWAGTDPFLGTDRFTQNRRVSSARWRCLDGNGAEIASADQSFQDAPRSQATEVTGFVGCAEVAFEILGSTSSGGRDFTALAEVELLGPTSG